MPRIFRLSFLLLCMVLPGCSFAPIINQQAMDYFRANDQAANQIILLNILRAKDGAPLHFSELSQIRGSFTAGALASTTLPYGPVNHATQLVRKLGTFSVNVSDSPSFDIASLDTKDFTTGVMKPISPDTFSFFLNEGIDYRMVLMLLVSSIKLPSFEEPVLNAPNSSRGICYQALPGKFAIPSAFQVVTDGTPCPVQPELEFYAYLRAIGSIGRIYPVSAKSAPRPVGAPFALDIAHNLKAVTNIDPAKYTLMQVKSGPDKGKFQLMTVARSGLTVLCEAGDKGPRVVSALGGEGGEVRVPRNACDPGAAADDQSAPDPKAQVTVGKDPGTFVIKLRSTFEVIQYVGQILNLQQRQTEDDALHNPDKIEQCITLEPQQREGGLAHDTCANDGELFDLRQGEAPDGSIANVGYDGDLWSLPAPPSCADGDLNDCYKPEKYDHTLETMAMISLLLNQNKSAKDIATTPAVQSVP